MWSGALVMKALLVLNNYSVVSHEFVGGFLGVFLLVAQRWPQADPAGRAS